MTAILKWERTEHRHAPGHIWRLYADPDTLAKLGGAPCFSSPAPGQIAYVVRERGLWRGQAELTPYNPITTPGRRAADTAMDDVLVAVMRHLEALP